VKYAESFGANGYRINHTDELLPILKSALEDDAVSVITCPVDYSQNIELTNKLGLVSEAL
jgi:acetolactate synthase-1/2/3 large subunit